MCRIAAILFALTYAFALGFFAIGTLGAFAQDRDPLAGVFLIPIGLPWNLLADAPDPGRLWLAAAAPAVNLVLLVLLCRRLETRRS